jgi:hypothetical protein
MFVLWSFACVPITHNGVSAESLSDRRIGFFLRAAGEPTPILRIAGARY